MKVCFEFVEIHYVSRQYIFLQSEEPKKIFCQKMLKENLLENLSLTFIKRKISPENSIFQKIHYGPRARTNNLIDEPDERYPHRRRS